MKTIGLIFFSWATTSLLFFYTPSYAGSSEDYYNHADKQFFSSPNNESQIRDKIKKLSRGRLEPLGYNSWAKKILFGEVELERDSSGFYIKDVYCGRVVRKSVGPKKIPHNNIMNTEHTWPQSLGSKYEPFRGDLHHLFPTDSKANSMRGNYPFGEVTGSSLYKDCQARRGHIKNPDTRSNTNIYGFEPPDEHKGNVARAMFYSAIVYDKNIDQLQEYYLRKWHKQDPPDRDEIERNNIVEDSQGNRNPFIDYPEIVDQIADF